MRILTKNAGNPVALRQHEKPASADFPGFRLSTADQVYFSRMASQVSTPDPVVKIGDMTAKRIIREVDLPGFSKPVEIWQFEGGRLDGFRVGLIDYQDGVPLVNIDEIVHSGAFDEPEAQRGKHHLLEHFLTDGTDPVVQEHYVNYFEKLGAATNAETGFFHTRYWVHDLHRDQLEEALPVFGRMIDSPLALPEQDFQKEKNVVIEEIKSRTPPPFLAKAQEITQQHLTPKEFYTQDVVGGFKETLDKLTLPDLQACQRDNYHYANRLLLISGDIRDPQAVLKLVADSHVQEFPKASVRTRDFSAYRKISAIPGRQIIRHAKVPFVSYARVYQGPDPNSPDFIRESIGLSYLSMILQGDASSRLHEKLFEDEKKALSVFMSFDAASKAHSYITVGFESTPENYPAALQLLNHELRDLKNHPFQQSEIDDVNNAYEANMERLRRDPDMAAILGAVSTTAAGRFKFNKMRNGHQIRFALKPPDLEKAARYLNQKPFYELMITPDTLQPRPGFKVTDVKFSGRLHPKYDQSFKIYGSEVILRPVQDSNITTVSAYIKGGNADDLTGSNQLGQTSFLANLLSCGPKDCSKKEYVRLLKRKAISASVKADEMGIRLVVSGLSKHKPEIFKVFNQLLGNPAFRKEDVDHIRYLLEKNIEASKVNPTVIASEALRKVIYPENHPYRNITLENQLKTARSMSVSHLESLFQQRVTPSNVTFAFSGNITAGEARQTVQDWMMAKRFPAIHRSKLPPGFQSGLSSLLYHIRPVSRLLGVYKTTPALKPPDIPRLNIAKSKLLVQTVPHISYPVSSRLWSAPLQQDADYYPLRVLCNILNRGGRLFDLYRREHRGTTYDQPSLAYIATRYQGSLVFSVSTSPQHIQALNDLFDREIQGLAEHPPSKAQVQQAVRRMTIPTLKILRLHEKMALYLAKHRALDSDSLEEEVEHLEKVTPEDVQRVARYLLKPSVTMIVAPEGAMAAVGFEQNKMDEPPTEKVIQWPSERLAGK